MTDVQQVDIPGLFKVADAVAASVGTLGRAQGAHEHGLDAAGALGGWATGPALTAGAARWAQFLGELHTQVDTFGGNLRTSAQNYQAADQHAADQVGQAGQGRPR